MNYNLEMLEFNRFRERVKYPDYQREYVWNKQMQRSLVLSVLDDLPIGTITVYKDENSNFIVIDGLQRINTMLNYCEKISSLYYYKDVEKKLQIKKILTEKLNSENEAKELNKCLKKWYKDEANLERRVNGKVVRNISSDFLKATKVKYDRVMIEDLVEEITNAIISIADINNYRIPLLVCDDAQEQLPIVFERMNTVQKN